VGKKEILGIVVKELESFKWYCEISCNGTRLELATLPWS